MKNAIETTCYGEGAVIHGVCEVLLTEAPAATPIWCPQMVQPFWLGHDVVCRNPDLAAERARKQQDLLAPLSAISCESATHCVAGPRLRSRLARLSIAKRGAFKQTNQKSHRIFGNNLFCRDFPQFSISQIWPSPEAEFLESPSA